MNTTRIGAAVLAAATAAVIVIAGPASADTIASETPPVVLAQDTTPAPATIPADVVGIDANLVGGLTITGHQGKTVTATAKGRPTRTATVPASRPAILKGLTPGVRYAVSIGGRKVATAVPLAQVGAASALHVETTTTPGTVQLSWKHTVTPHEGATITYDVTATPLNDDGTDGAVVISARTTGTSATLTGLDTKARYRFAVTPRNIASTGRASSATMTRTLADITGTSPKKPEPAAVAPQAPATPPAPSTPAAPAPAPAGPSTRTIYVCPSGYADAGDTCTDTKAYTLHTETVTQTYTYHNGIVGSHIVHHNSTDPCSYLPNPNSPTGLDIYCPPGWDETVYDYGQIKDATPTGFADNGTAWVKTVQVKDTAPAGYADSGTAWIKTVGKIAQVVPA